MNIKLAPHVAQVRKYEAGETLVRKNTKDARLCILLSGSLAVYEDDPASSPCLGLLKPGDFYGEAGLFLGKAAEASVAALSDSMVLLFDKNDISELFVKQPQSAFEMVQSICARAGELARLAAPDSASWSANRRRLLISEASHASPPPAVAPRPESAPKESFPAPLPIPETQAPVLSKPAEQPAAQTRTGANPPENTAAGVSSLFPPGHRRYGATKKPHDPDYLRDKTMKCPLCQASFKIITPRASKLITESTDADMRIRYRRIEPMYYEICTCPYCLYSALTDLFPNGFASRATLVRNRLAPYKNELTLKHGYELDMDSVFTSYYLALQCAQPCFDSHLNITAMLWLKISRLYADCEDEAMRAYAGEETLKAYMKVFDNADVSGEKAQRLYVSIGECALAVGDTATARRFFYMAKVEKYASPALKDHADRRIEDMRNGETGDDR